MFDFRHGRSRTPPPSCPCKQSEPQNLDGPAIILIVRYTASSQSTGGSQTTRVVWREIDVFTMIWVDIH